MTRILVTGAAGFSGSHLSEALIARGGEVTGIDNFDPFYPRPIKQRNLEALQDQKGFTFKELDLLDRAALQDLLTPDSSAGRFVEGLQEAAARFDKERADKEKGNFFPVIVIVGSLTAEGSSIHFPNG